MKVVTISGTYGSGKTTLIKQLIRRAAERERVSSVIVNEEGDERYEDDFLRDYGVEIERLRGG